MRKAMPPHKLAELWLVDPKRAKRVKVEAVVESGLFYFVILDEDFFPTRATGTISVPKKNPVKSFLVLLSWVSYRKGGENLRKILANRQSAARSKERKARYISELERTVEALQTKVTTLTTQVSLYQRDTTDLTAENTELKRQLQSMQRKAQLHDDLTELKREAQRLRIATEEIGNPLISLNLGVHHKQYCSSSSGSDYLQLPQSPGPAGHPKFQLSLFPSSPLTPSPRHIATPGPRPLAKHVWNDPVGHLQALDISSREYIAQVDCASISSSASESSSTTY
ncbi:hypothetical protein RJ639_028285 [Escallonia herrerae]|uniref:BZIP domain-containing protein n=1 Tax=Escallonia herrerae TaxID=1293975 RepID=A0AA88X547_9ASTE|nr:hypothetical protein RJ639_028285 [Escallonia herrerae]